MSHPTTTTTSIRPPPDLSHHLSFEAKNRPSNPMKDIWKLVQSRNHADVVSLANGDPHHTLYPFSRISFEIPSLEDTSTDPITAWRSAASNSTTTPTSSKSLKTQTISISKDSTSDTYLRTSLAYTNASGLPPTLSALNRFTQYLHSPPPSAAHTVTLSLGNCDGVSKVFRVLGETGEVFLTERWAFGALTNAAVACGIGWVGVGMDEGGMIPNELERVLGGWDEEREGKRRPHVLYIVPCGQNPTGSTLSLERRRQIYRIAQEWDLIIVEDDPYYFMQYDLAANTPSDFASSLVPSFLSMDVDGRVIRVDSFSKILAPGMRLGWITASPIFIEKLIMYTDSSTQHPHAFGQMFISKLLDDPVQGWGIEGLLTWVKSLCEDYQRRRDKLLAAFCQGSTVGVMRSDESKLGGGVVRYHTPYASVTEPTSGMFVWIEIHLEKHPRFRRSYYPAYRSAHLQALPLTPPLTPPASSRSSSSDNIYELATKPLGTDDLVKGGIRKKSMSNTRELMEELFEKLLDNGVVLMPAAMFKISDVVDITGGEALCDHLNFFRATFCGTPDAIEKGMKRFWEVLEMFFRDDSMDICLECESESGSTSSSDD